jgi:hypothetical protein
MNLFRTQSTRRRGKTFTPRLESLEDRSLLSCGVMVGGNVLTVTGDNGANHVVITDNGTGGPQNIKVQCDGPPQTIFAPIATVLVQTQGGPDSVRYNLPNGLQPGVARQVRVDLGDGANLFGSTIGGDLGDKSRLQLYVQGGKDKDTLAAGAVAGFRIHPGALLSLTMNGNGGADDIRASYQTRLDGVLGLDLNGGDGNDHVAAGVTLDAGSTGMLSSLSHPATVSGGPGDDDLTFIVHNSGAATVFARLDGGPGKDVGTHTINVPPTAIEVDQLVP